MKNGVLYTCTACMYRTGRGGGGWEGVTQATLNRLGMHCILAKLYIISTNYRHWKGHIMHIGTLDIGGHNNALYIMVCRYIKEIL